MDNDYQTKDGNVPNQDVDEAIDYIYNAIKNIIRNTIVIQI